MKTCRIQKNQKKKSRRRLIHFVIAKSTEAAIQKKSRSKDVHPTQSHNHRTTWNPRLSGKRACHEARNLRVVHTHENYNRPPRYTFSSSFHSSFLSFSLCPCLSLSTRIPVKNGSKRNVRRKRWEDECLKEDCFRKNRESRGAFVRNSLHVPYGGSGVSQHRTRNYRVRKRREERTRDYTQGTDRAAWTFLLLRS